MVFYDTFYPLPDEPIDIDELTRQNRIIIYGDTFFFASGPKTAKYRAKGLGEDKCVVLSPTQAAIDYPQYFFRSSLKEVEIKDKTITVALKKHQVRFCYEKGAGNVSSFIRSLIDKAIEEDESEKG